MGKIIGKGAEAIIYLEGGTVVKKRISKSYRHSEIDKRLIKRRTKAETKILKKASDLIAVPRPEDSPEFDEIRMPFVEGEKISRCLDDFSLEKQKKIMREIGASIATLHQEGIIHGDLTTSNMILSKDRIYFIDFGLGYLNGKYEGKGVDLHLLRQALEAKHFKNWEILFEEVKKGYSSVSEEQAEKVFQKIESIEKRGRYKH